MAGRTRTRTKSAAPAPTPEPEVEENGSVGLRPVGALHEHMAEWLNDAFGDELDAELTPRQVQVVISKRNVYRKSDEYLAFKEEQDELREQAEVEAANKPKRVRKVVDADEAEEVEEAPKPKRGRSAKAKPAAETEEAEVPAAKPRTRRRTAAPAAEGEAATPAPARRRRRAAAAPTDEPF